MVEVVVPEMVLLLLSLLDLWLRGVVDHLSKEVQYQEMLLRDIMVVLVVVLLDLVLEAAVVPVQMDLVVIKV